MFIALLRLATVLCGLTCAIIGASGMVSKNEITLVTGSLQIEIAKSFISYAILWAAGVLTTIYGAIQSRREE